MSVRRPPDAVIHAAVDRDRSPDAVAGQRPGLESLDLALGRIRRLWEQPEIRSWVASGLDLGEVDASSFRTLRAVGELGAEGASVNGVAEMLRIDASTASRFLDRAQACGHVERAPSATDRRKSLFSLTAAGRTQLLRVRQRRLELLARLTETWLDHEIEQFVDLLDRFDDAVIRFGLDDQV